MTNENISLQQLNRTFLGSVLFIDIVGYSKLAVSEQLEIKEIFNKLLIGAIQNVAEIERILVDTGDGAAAAFLGDPEDALFAALSLRDAIAVTEIPHCEPGFVRMGINLGPLKIVRDINGHTNMIGDGVNDAQRVMSFAEPGQVTVSHSYYDIISRFSRDYANLFVYEGRRQDKHVREHEIYRVGPDEQALKLAEKMRDRSRARLSDDPYMTWQPGIKSPPIEPVKLKPGGSSWLNARTGLAAAAICAAGVAGAWWYRAAADKPPAVAVSAPTPAASAPKAAAAPSTASASHTAQHASAPGEDKAPQANHKQAKPAIQKAAEHAKPAEQKSSGTHKCKVFHFTMECSDAPTTPQGL